MKLKIVRPRPYSKFKPQMGYGDVDGRVEALRKTRLLRDYSKTRGKPREPRTANFTKERVMNAMTGTMGQWTAIAKNLKCHPNSVANRVKSRGWEDVYDYWMQEKNKIIDSSEKTVRFMVRQRDDFPTALSAAKYVLASKGVRRGWVPKKEITVQGGDKPLQIAEPGVIDVSVLNLPLKVRKALLEAIEAQEKKLAKPTKKLVIKAKRVS